MSNIIKVDINITDLHLDNSSVIIVLCFTIRILVYTCNNNNLVSCTPTVNCKGLSVHFFINIQQNINCIHLYG